MSHASGTFMRLRGLLVASFIFFLLTGILYWSEHRKPAADNPSAAASASPAILKLDESTITKLDLEQRDASPVVLAKASSGTWEITQPKPLRADQSLVSGMLAALSSLSSERVVEDSAVDLTKYGLERPALAMAITEKDNKSQRLLLGDDTPTGGAVYAKLAEDPRIFTLASSSKNNIDKSLNDLRDKRLLPLNSDEISRIELLAGSKDIVFARNQDGWFIQKPEALRADSFQVSELDRKLTEAKMDLSGSPRDRTVVVWAHAAPLAIARVTSKAGSEELQLRKDKDTYYAKSSMGDGVYRVDSDLGKALDQGLDEFRNKKLFDFGFTNPSKIEMHDGSKAYFWSRNNDDWWSNGRKVDAGSMQSLIAELRDLSAEKFVKSGFADPTIEATVTSEDGKRVEKVMIAKAGGAYLAKRADESTLYQLAPAPLDDLRKTSAGMSPAASPNK
jgi:hypothetical protein